MTGSRTAQQEGETGVGASGRVGAPVSFDFGGWEDEDVESAGGISRSGSQDSASAGVDGAEAGGQSGGVRRRSREAREIFIEMAHKEEGSLSPVASLKQGALGAPTKTRSSSPLRIKPRVGVAVGATAEVVAEEEADGLDGFRGLLADGEDYDDGGKTGANSLDFLPSRSLDTIA
eukprot:CAMPEP_0173378058 /NCGR_PEP_ID=MMETSP1356-20130122/1284_1 /TAXON_ID=77927 ORGANISM="Hemiselmis virescens, Strain PCC157" /NCGR_SAMPLE_ID=MMETSP1356 /ASSEMBLY_ACC=CAM_ASM_000847 /LENGTH=174 /DNA_ID=CAMNT_0014331015 /DNA_START=121 /DNA_END=645 /DNA_ORIENTATION=+